MSQDLVLLEKAGRIATLTLNRPDKLNAMNEALLESLFGLLQELDDSDDVLVIIVCGPGRSFCAGYDIAPGSDGGRSGYFELRRRRGRPVAAAQERQAAARVVRVADTCNRAGATATAWPVAANWR